MGKKTILDEEREKGRTSLIEHLIITAITILFGIIFSLGFVCLMGLIASPQTVETNLLR